MIDSFKDDFYQRFDMPNGYQAFVVTSRYLNSLKAAKRFELLFSVLCDPHEHPFQVQKVASGLLMKQDAKCGMALSAVVEPILGGLDASIQEYPFFLAHVFGVDKLREELCRLKGANLSTRQLQGINTFEYWIKGFSEERYTELRVKWCQTIRG